jgi:hypothetical protein
MKATVQASRNRFRIKMLATSTIVCLLLVVCWCTMEWTRVHRPSQSRVEPGGPPTVSISGAIHRPTMISWSAGLSVLDAVTLAGDVANDADLRGVRIHRNSDSGGQVLRVDLAAIRETGDARTNFPLLPGDRVVIPSKRAILDFLRN